MLRTALWSKQREIAESVRDNPLTACRSANKVGKTTLAAGLGIWWYATRPRAAVIATSASYTNLRSAFWRELRRLWRRGGGDERFGGEMPVDPMTGCTAPDGRLILGISVNEEERAQGFSGDVFIIADEASGIPDDVWHALRRNLAGGGRALMIGNPNRPGVGAFYAAFTDSADLWSTFAISAYDSPNVTGAEPAVPGLATREHIELMIAEYGGGDEEVARLHPTYRIGVLGQWPQQSSHAVIGLGAIAAARQRWHHTAQGSGRLVLGVDPARFGDDESCLQPLRGYHAHPALAFQQLDTVELAGRVLEVATDLHRPGDPIPLVVVDDGGLGGGVTDQLRRSPLVEVLAVNAGSRSTELGPTGELRYERMRDQLWGQIADWIADGGALPDDPRRDAELLAVEKRFTPSQRIKVDGKDDIRKRLGRSPDRADALGLGVHGVLSRYQGCPIYSNSSPRTRGRFAFSGIGQAGQAAWKGW